MFFLFVRSQNQNLIKAVKSSSFSKLCQQLSCIYRVHYEKNIYSFKMYSISFSFFRFHISVEWICVRVPIHPESSASADVVDQHGTGEVIKRQLPPRCCCRCGEGVRFCIASTCWYKAVGLNENPLMLSTSCLMTTRAAIDLLQRSINIWAPWFLWPFTCFILSVNAVGLTEENPLLPSSSLSSLNLHDINIPVSASTANDNEYVPADCKCSFLSGCERTFSGFCFWILLEPSQRKTHFYHRRVMDPKHLSSQMWVCHVSTVHNMWFSCFFQSCFGNAGGKRSGGGGVEGAQETTMTECLLMVQPLKTCIHAVLGAEEE